MLEVPHDRVGASIETLGCELAAELDDKLDGRCRRRTRLRAWSPRTRFECRISFRSIAGNERVHP